MGREALAGDTYLLKRGNVWYLRIRVPTKLVRDGESTHVTRSLKTKDKREARRLANLRLAEIEAQFRAAEHSLRPSLSVARRLDELSDGEIERTVADWFHHEANLTRDQFYSGIDADEAVGDDMPVRPAETLKELRDDLGTMENASDRQGRSGLDHLVAEAARFAGLQMRQMELGKIRLARTEIDADQNGKKYKLLICTES